MYPKRMKEEAARLRLEGLTHAEIGEKLGVSAKTAGIWTAHISRGKHPAKPRTTKKKDLTAEFWKRVDKNGPTQECMRTEGVHAPCWVWTGAFGGKGYGQLTCNRKRWSAHCLSVVIAQLGDRAWMLDPTKSHVLHRCDNPACVRPSHLFLGTDQDNRTDSVKKGRQSTKLTEKQAKEILRRFELFSHTNGGRALARKFGVSHNAITALVRGHSWQHLRTRGKNALTRAKQRQQRLQQKLEAVDKEIERLSQSDSDN